MGAQAGIHHGRQHAVFGLLHCGVGQAHNLDARLTLLARVDLDFDGDGFHPDEGGRTEDGEHAYRQGRSAATSTPLV